MGINKSNIDLTKIHSETIEIDEIEINEIYENIKKNLPSYLHDQYRNYPSKQKNAWEKYLLFRLKKSFNDNERIFFYEIFNKSPYLLCCKISKWDENIFGFKTASLTLLLCENSTKSRKNIGKILDKCMKTLKKMNVKFISARINSNNLLAIHIFENKGFKYYENILWSILSCKNLVIEKDPDIRLMNKNDLNTLLKLAENNFYQYGHYYLDTKFNNKKVNSLYSKWLNTSWKNNEPISVIELDGKVKGFFIFKIDELLSKAMGYKYGRNRLLVLESNARGKGLGKRLFQGGMSIMKEMGVEYIDSGYPSRNHISANLQTIYSYYSVYEEVTFHKWL